MSVAIRLKRLGRKKKPFYHVVVMDSRTRRDGLPIETLGWFCPMTDETKLKIDRYDYWTSVGAQPSDRVKSVVSNYNKTQA